MPYPNLNYALAGTLLVQLRQGGCRRVVISPGSRSTPLAHVAMRTDGLTPYVLTDERSAAYFALGLSRAEQVPAILICTSGTAAANYFPAVIEAAQGLVPLLVLTADRPLSLRHTGAPQTIDQVDLYGRYARFFAETPAATEVDALTRARELARSALAATQTQPWGPAQLNVPFAEPLAPVSVSLHSPACAALEPLAVVAEVDTPCELADAVEQRVRDAFCGVIVCGPGAARDEAEARALHGLARQLGWPLFADVISGVRFCGEPVITASDLLLRHSALAALAPDTVLAFGAHPTSRVLNEWLDAHRDAYTLRVQPHARVQDPSRRATATLIADCRSFCEQLAARITVARDSLLLDPFQSGMRALRGALHAWDCDADPDAELAYVWAALRETSTDTRVIFANSLSIRYGDTLAGLGGGARAAFGMRGANGIDGTLSHAAGIAAAVSQPTLLVTGDLAFLHDLSGLFAVQRFAANLTVLLLNNDGGGIFHFLPVQGTSEHFERIHGTPHGLRLHAAADLFGVEWIVADRPIAVTSAMRRVPTGARVIEARTNRNANLLAHNRLLERFAAAAVS